jgi:hypothetical protein
MLRMARPSVADQFDPARGRVAMHAAIALRFDRNAAPEQRDHGY